MEINYPSELHSNAAEEITNFFSKISEVNAVLLTCSCARGKATKDSCLDIAVLHSPSIEKERKQYLIKKWNEEYCTNKIYEEIKKIGHYSQVDLDFIDGDFSEGNHTWTTGPDDFELEIGNFIAYSIPLCTNGSYFQKLKDKWLPYYDEQRRLRRFEMIKKYCLNNLDHISVYTRRKLYFQCFKRLYDALREFLQMLFISRKIYPVAYDKWIEDQLCNLIKLPDIYNVLVKIMEFKKFESDEHIAKAKMIEELITVYCNCI